MKTYRKKPVEIEASQFTGGAAAATPLIGWMLNHGVAARAGLRCHRGGRVNNLDLAVDTRCRWWNQPSTQCPESRTPVVPFADITIRHPEETP